MASSNQGKRNLAERPQITQHSLKHMARRLRRASGKMRHTQAMLLAMQRIAQVGGWMLQLSSQTITATEEACHILGLEWFQEISHAQLLEAIAPDDRAIWLAALNEAVVYGTSFQCEVGLVWPQGGDRYIEARGEALRNVKGQVHEIVGTVLDITERKQTETALRHQSEQETLLSNINQRIRQSLRLDDILQTAVSEVRQLLQTDRVVVYRFMPSWEGRIEAESVSDRTLSILGRTIHDPCFQTQWAELYRQGRVAVIENIYTSKISPCHLATLAALKVQANLVVPILQNDHLWGLLIAHHCVAPRPWADWEVAMLQRLSIQMAIALQQSETYHQLQALNHSLEQTVRDRTAALELAVEAQGTLQRIISRVRDNLDEQQILQAAVRELTLALGVNCCDAALFDFQQGISTVCYEYTTAFSSAQGRVTQIADFPELYSQLIQGEYFQFCSLLPNPARGRVATLACPIRDDQGVLGSLWLVDQGDRAFSPFDIRLAQQVADQCAIALRQARLYEAAQSQVRELEQLNRLKDDFLSTISHELRTPMSNIKMAIQMLDIQLNRAQLLEDDSTPIQRYLQILQAECDREINLVNDLLTFSHRDRDWQVLTQDEIDLQRWIPTVTEAFVSRAAAQQQQLKIEVAANLPPLKTHIPSLERIVTELLNNACKYTQSGETITISAQCPAEQPPDYPGNARSMVSETAPGWDMGDRPSVPALVPAVARSPALLLQVSNTGVEIAAEEWERIFEKFYRIPQNDPWKHGGTGLGLAMAKKLSRELGAELSVSSGNNQTTFTLRFPP